MSGAVNQLRKASSLWILQKITNKQKLKSKTFPHPKKHNTHNTTNKPSERKLNLIKKKRPKTLAASQLATVSKLINHTHEKKKKQFMIDC